MSIKIFDCFIFGQRELAILHLRIDTLCHTVDHMILAQGTTSHSGVMEEPFLSPATISALEQRCPGKVHAVLIDTSLRGVRSKHRQWLVLETQMNGAVARARELGMAASDVVVVSEHDEIPNPTLLEHYASSGSLGSEPRLVVMKTRYYYYYHGACNGDDEWYFGFVANGAALSLCS